MHPFNYWPRITYNGRRYIEWWEGNQAFRFYYVILFKITDLLLDQQTKPFNIPACYALAVLLNIYLNSRYKCIFNIFSAILTPVLFLIRLHVFSTEPLKIEPSSLIIGPYFFNSF